MELRYKVLPEADRTVEVSKYVGAPTDLVIPETVENNGVKYAVTSIGDEAFVGCTSMVSVTIPNSVTSIGGCAFYGCTSLASVTIPNSVTSIRWSAFHSCTSLASVTIPNSVTSIENGIFNGCTSLTSVTIPNSVTSIGTWAFYGCTSLASVTIPNSVTSIGRKAFQICTSLTSVTIPNSVTCIEQYAFEGCTSLTSVTISNSVTSIGTWAFSNCTSLEEILVDAENVNYSSDNGILYNKDKTELIQCPGARKEVAIPNTVTSIGMSAFENCTSLASVTIPNSVTSIGEYAFWNCSSMRTIYSEPATPPQADADAFRKVPEDAVVYVPEGTIGAYSVANEWNRFTDFREMTSTGVSELIVGQNARQADIYNMHGILVKANATQDDIEALAPGLYIIEGRKVLVK